MTALFSSVWPVLGAAVLAIGSAIYAFVTKKSSDAKVAQANQKTAEAQTSAAQAQTQTAETRDIAAQANTAAAQAGANAIKERNDVENNTAAMSDSAVRDELRDWVQPAAGVGAVTAGAGADASH
jgi:hypothetical protein